MQPTPTRPIVAPLDATFGAHITGIALDDLDDEAWAVVEEAFHTYAALVFPGQHLSAEAQAALGERFGAIEYLREGQKHAAVSNVRPDGSVMAPNEKRYQTLRGNEGWHTDSSYMPLAAKVSILSAQVVPARGGETELADMRDAFDQLAPEKREHIEGLSAIHSLYASQAKAGFVFKTGEAYGYHVDGAPLRPLIKVHPVTGRRSLFIGRHAHRIPGLDDTAAQRLLDELLDFACRPPRTYRHAWRAGDVMLWDNRCVLHRACPYDYNEPRVMRHVRVAGDPNSELAPTVADERADGFEPPAPKQVEATG